MERGAQAEESVAFTRLVIRSKIATIVECGLKSPYGLISSSKAAYPIF